jgi:hypothetical protein
MLDVALAMQKFPDCPLQFQKTDETAARDAQEPLYELVLDADDQAFSSRTLANDGHYWRTRDLFRRLVHVDEKGNELELFIYETRKDDMLMLVTCPEFHVSLRVG